ncbi:MAG: hypothetical protein ABJB33_10145 [Gemmatimonadota bacterium]
MTMLLLRLVHIVIGTFWVGSVIFTTFFLFPSLLGNPAAMGTVMQGLNRRKLMQVLPTAALVTMVSGLWMVWITSGGDIGGYVQSRSGHSFVTAGGLAIFAFLLGFIFARPAGIKAGQLGAQMAATTDAGTRTQLQAEMTALQKRAGTITVVVALLLIIAAAGMAVARYI